MDCITTHEIYQLRENDLTLCYGHLSEDRHNIRISLVQVVSEQEDREPRASHFCPLLLTIFRYIKPGAFLEIYQHIVCDEPQLYPCFLVPIP